MEITTAFDPLDLIAAPKPKGGATAPDSNQEWTEELADTCLASPHQRSEVVIASRSTGRHVLGAPDSYANQLSRFDCQARLNIPFRHLAATPQMYLGFAAAQVLEWTQDERAALSRAVESVRQKWARLELALPARIYLVKTSGREEDGPYTRPGLVVLPDAVLGQLRNRAGWPCPQTHRLTELESLLLAAFFHLALYHRPVARQQLYGLVGWRLLDNQVSLPNTLWGVPGADDFLPNLRGSRPQATTLQVGLEMDVPRCPWTATGQFVRRWLVPVLLARGPYEGGTARDYLQWWFIAVELTISGCWEACIGPGEKPLLYRSVPLMEQYVEHMGSVDRTQLRHPDEIMARNFVQAASRPGSKLLDEMALILA
ncbi:MAG: hypothetical protein GKR89_06515 [Candidatus Latescibacteria bacterium]|nr:hypothetical protein [Candidatus Latescibacterota bacterium]